MQLTKNELIAKLYNDSNVNSMLKTINHYHCDDFKQELFLILLQMPEEKLFELQNKNELYPFINKIITNQTHSNTSEFYRKYRKHSELISYVGNFGEVECELENSYDLQKSYDAMLEEINKIDDWYERTLTKYVLITRMTVLDIADKTAISRRQIYRIVGKHRRRIYEALKKQGLHFEKIKGYKTEK